MLILVLGKGKTGALVAEVARERGHGVRALDIDENEHASALTAPNLAGVDVVVDFTAPEAAVENMRAVLALGGRIVVGTTGWYAQARRDEGARRTTRRRAALRDEFFHRRAEALPADGGAGEARRLQVLDRRDAPRDESSTRLRARRSRSRKSFSLCGRGSMCRSIRIA